MSNYYLVKYKSDLWELYIVESCYNYYNWILIETNNLSVRATHVLPYSVKLSLHAHKNLLLKTEEIHDIRKYFIKHFEDFL